jgi:hypothetical protein
LFAARRSGVDPASGRKPATEAGRERLAKQLADAPERQDHAFGVLMLTYADAFGQEAADAFSKSMQARHAGIEVTIRRPKAQPDSAVASPTSSPIHTRVASKRRRPAVLPVPRPLPAAVAAGHFGVEEDGRNVRPGPAEVRAITECHAAKLVSLLHEIESPGADRDQLKNAYRTAIAAYAEDFGEESAARLDAHARSQAIKQHGQSQGR